MKKVAIIGKGEAGKAAAAQLNKAGIDTVILDDDVNDSILVNDVKYVPIPRVKTSGAAARLLAIASMFGGMPGIKEPERPDVDIPTEFALIQRKKSNLSRSQRDWVEDVFHANFKKV